MWCLSCRSTSFELRVAGTSQNTLTFFSIGMSQVETIGLPGVFFLSIFGSM